MASNFRMMLSLGWENWLRLFAWLAVGMVLYFAYGRRHSRLARVSAGRQPRHPRTASRRAPPRPVPRSGDGTIPASG